MASANLEISIDRDWMALNAYRMALEAIIDTEGDSWECRCEEMRALAESVIEQFPGSFKGRGRPSQ